MKTALFNTLFIFICSAFAMDSNFRRTEEKFVPSKATCGAAIKADGSFGFPDNLEAALMCFKAGYRHFYETYADLSAIKLSPELREVLAGLSIVTLDKNGYKANFIYDDEGKVRMATSFSTAAKTPCINCEFMKNEKMDNDARILRGIKNGILYGYEKEDIFAFLKREHVGNEEDFEKAFTRMNVQITEQSADTLRYFDEQHANGRTIILSNGINVNNIIIPCSYSRHEEFMKYNKPAINLF